RPPAVHGEHPRAEPGACPLDVFGDLDGEFPGGNDDEGGGGPGRTRGGERGADHFVDAEVAERHSVRPPGCRGAGYRLVAGLGLIRLSCQGFLRARITSARTWCSGARPTGCRVNSNANWFYGIPLASEGRPPYPGAS